MKKHCLIYLLFCFCATAFADIQEQDALRLWRQHTRQSTQQQHEKHTINDSQPLNEITIDGQSFEVEQNVQAVGQALYIALNQQLWQYAEKFLAQYKTFADHKTELVWFAEGALAHERGDFSLAEQRYHQLLQAQPDFLRGQLDLARILFKDKKNMESAALFRKIAQQPLPESVLDTVRDYQQALEQRERWYNSFTFGYLYNKNLNQSPQQEKCLLESNGQCLINRRSPDAINTHGWRYDFTAQRRISLHSHHGLAFYLNSYGQFYPHEHEYNENTLKTYVGYSFSNANTEISVAPLLEHNVFGNHRNYHGWGGHFEWTQNISSRHLWNMQFEQKRLHYSDHYSSFTKANLSTLFGTWYYLYSPKTTLFGGVDWQYRSTPDHAQAYHLLGARLGFNHQFDFGLNATAIALLRRYNYQSYHAALEVTRKDRQQIYLLILKMPQWNFKGITPNLLFKHTRNHSNADYIYSYKQSEVQLNFELQF
ncbi:surface lipoprotein assembly modifier [Gallibacterium salpingitidis]|uniref:surface lipoprotein assembly modifier n=1 Tax=Gallibacterium salpingitidis TaxID=505341 RepID=UPI00266F6616|nr:surface lipoprotein assembly modifier [Gallibacterium salpingitidis]WKT00557.1 surface lipoprotein assembly modifier [Gallibacterium salpingitidis]